MKNKNITKTYLKDYLPPIFCVESVELTLELDSKQTIVTSELTIYKNKKNIKKNSLWLDGIGLELISLKLNGLCLSKKQYIIKKNGIEIRNVPDNFILTIQNSLSPENNKAFQGIYISGKNICTQCEAEGFRRITYYPDRPDILSNYKVKLIANKKNYPILLSNGNCVEKGILENEKHFAVWHDPFPKPCYLFAVVAGTFDILSGTFRSKSNKLVALKLFVSKDKKKHAQYALKCLQNAMKWDEDYYNLEYDLDEFNIVAISDFNMGAMENKSLNIFNEKYVLADPLISTDEDYESIESIVAHEYFHNWTGNRVTCRDWFQLSLKEGLTVYREQQFLASTKSKSVQRIKEVIFLRSMQFIEDNGPLAHSVRPQSYSEINNFYTYTVYEKGSEIIRMINTLLGDKLFRKGIKLYLKKFDGKAATCENLVQAMEEASKIKLKNIMLWYDQPGTPKIRLDAKFDKNKIYSLKLKQLTKESSKNTPQKPMNIPLRISFIDPVLGSVKSKIKHSKSKSEKIHLLNLTERETQIQFTGFPKNCSKPLIVLNKGFSSPVQTIFKYSLEDLNNIVKLEPDGFSKWNAIQELTLRILEKRISGKNCNDELPIYLESMNYILDNQIEDESWVAEAIKNPNLAILEQRLKNIDPIAIYHSRNWLDNFLYINLETKLTRLYRSINKQDKYMINYKSIGKRKLKNTVLNLISSNGDESSLEIAYKQYETSNNMTDKWEALKVLNKTKSELREKALKDFYKKCNKNELTIDKWLSLEATHPFKNTLKRVKELVRHGKYNKFNPNKIRALIGSFAKDNPIGFHQTSGVGYSFLENKILEIDKSNPQIASRLLTNFQKWNIYEEKYKKKMILSLKRIKKEKKLSLDCREIVTMCL